MQKQRYLRHEVTDQPMQSRGLIAQANPIEIASITNLQNKIKFSLHICVAWTRLTWSSNKLQIFYWYYVGTSQESCQGRWPSPLPKLPLFIHTYHAQQQRIHRLPWVPNTSMLDKTNKYRNPTYWYPWSAPDQPMPSHNQLAQVDPRPPRSPGNY